MKQFLVDIFYNENVNKFLREILKPFSLYIPEKYKFPINGRFKVTGNNVPPFKMVTNPTNAVTKFLFWDNIEGFEFNSVKVFCEVVKDSKVFFDIGSNIGYYSLLASSISNMKVEVHAFEPMPSIFEFLNKNILLNGFENIHAHQIALSDKVGEATFYSIVNPRFDKYPQLTGDGGLSITNSGRVSRINFDVKVDTLDNFVKHNFTNKKIGLIKLDTEANEHKVLIGAHDILRDHRPIIQCEILKNQIEKETLTVLASHNYLYYRASDKGLVAVDDFLNNDTNFVDYYLIPKEKKGLVQRFVSQ